MLFCLGGLIRQPKYCHLKELHRAIKLCEKALVSADPTVTSLGSLQQAHVLLFLSNYDTKSASRVWSIRILSECRNVIFNTAKVGFQTSQMEMLPSNADMISWETYSEDLSSLDDSSTFITFWSFGAN